MALRLDIEEMSEDKATIQIEDVDCEALANLLPDHDVTLPNLSRIAGGTGYRFAKRAVDVVLSTIALAALSLPMLVVAIVIRVQSAGPAIYRQIRVGCNGRLFNLYKFRSMYVDSEAFGAQWAEKDDPRVTPLGKWLRKYRIDEVPQFWNVFKGDMSLVGPRPERPVFHRIFCEHIHGWEQRATVLPGITGLAQVEGGYELLPEEKALIDIQYIETRSMCLDAVILFKTVITVLTGRGAR